MSAVNNTAPAAAASKTTRTAPEKAKEANLLAERRAKCMRRLFVRLIACMAAWAGIYTAQATGDMSTRLALGLAAAVLAAGAFYAGAWSQFMWCKGGVLNGRD